MTEPAVPTLQVPMGISALADGRLSASAAQRNRAPLVAALAAHLPPGTSVLELASGTGEHAVAFNQACPGLHWQATELDEERLRSIAAWRTAEGLEPAMAEPQRLDVTRPGWPKAPQATGWQAVLAVNLLHVMPEDGLPALFRHAAAALAPGGWLAIYGPFRQGANWFSEGNQAFHAQLQAQDPRLGLRDLHAMDALAQAAGLHALQVLPMPANNHLLRWHRATA